MSKAKVESIAASQFIHLIESGQYKKKKKIESFLEQSKAYLSDYFSSWEGKRHEFRNQNMVAKFVAKKVNETDHSGLIDELLCYVRHDVVFPLLQLDSKAIREDGENESLKSYLLPKTFYVRPTLNKVGKRKVGQYDFLFGGQSDEELIAEIRDMAMKHKQLESNYEDFKSIAEHCSMLQEKKKVQTPYGSVSLIAH